MAVCGYVVSYKEGNMKGWIAGLVVGVVLGSAVTGAAQGQWQRATGILGLSQSFRLGYVQGVDDMLSAVVSLQGTLARGSTGETRVILDKVQAFWQGKATCLHVHTQARAGEFLRWADGVWQSNVDTGFGDDMAAGLLIADACK